MCRAGVALATLLLPVVAAAGPWNRTLHGFYAKTGYAYQRATELATPDGNIAEIPTFTKHEASLYAEYGFSDRLTAIADLILYRHSAIEDFDSGGGIGDSRLGLQWQIGRGDSGVYAVRGIVQAPTGDAEAGSGLLPTGSGAWEGELWLAAGRSLWEGRGWAQAEAGYQARGEGLRDGFVYSGQFGVRAASWLLLMANLRGVQPFDSTPGGLSTITPVGLGDGVTYLVYGPAAIVELGRGAGLQFDLDIPTNVTNVAKGPTFRFAAFVSR